MEFLNNISSSKKSYSLFQSIILVVAACISTFDIAFAMRTLTVLWLL